VRIKVSMAADALRLVEQNACCFQWLFHGQNIRSENDIAHSVGEHGR